MRKLFVILFAFVFLPTCIKGQCCYTKEYTDKVLIDEAAEWLKKGEWRNGFESASPDSSVNIVEFYLQYKKNPAQWETLFKWLASADLINIPKGKYPLEDTGMTVSVEDSKNSELSKRRSESHYHHIDFQYVVKGIERFGIIEHNSSTPNCEYRPDVIHYDYDVAKTRFFDSSPDKFFIFFPSDWHIAKINNDTDNQEIRVVVIKVDYID